MATTNRNAALASLKAAATRLGVSFESYLSDLNEGKKICGGCRRSLPKTSEYFGKEGKKKDGLRSRCRECVSSTKKLHYINTRTYQRTKRLAYQDANRAKLYTYNKVWIRQYRARLRLEMIQAFGGRCECCGESEPIFLELDHINGDGKQKRREYGGNDLAELRYLQSKGWPHEGYRVLCCNCHHGRHRNGGVCPHETRAL